MKIVHLDDELTYDGRQLATSFFDERVPGEPEDALVAFLGAADVPVEQLVDLEDAETGGVIASPLMAHLLVEHRGLALREAVLRQRLLGHLAADWIGERAGLHVRVRGDDLFVDDGKLSVSVATASPRSALIHFAVNVLVEGTPVRAAGLRDLRIAPGEFLRATARIYAEEIDAARAAVRKVRTVR